MKKVSRKERVLATVTNVVRSQARREQRAGYWMQQVPDEWTYSQEGWVRGHGNSNHQDSREKDRDWRWGEGCKSAEAWERKGVIVGGECVPEEGFYLFFKDGSHSSVPECWWDGREKH